MGSSGPFPIWYLKPSSQTIPLTAASLRALQFVVVDISVHYFVAQTQLHTKSRLSAWHWCWGG